LEAATGNAEVKRRELQFEIQDESRIEPALRWVKEMVSKGLQAGAVRVSIGRPRRTLDQNAKMWPMLHDLAKQVDWYGQKLIAEEWKDVLTAGLKKQRAVPGIDGGFVILGAHTSKMSTKDLAELVELMYAFGAEHGVKWTDPKERVAA
jgi:hypothetical protein